MASEQGGREQAALLRKSTLAGLGLESWRQDNLSVSLHLL